MPRSATRPRVEVQHRRASATPAGTSIRANGSTRLDLSVSIALGSAVQIALFVAPVLVVASYAIGPSPLNLQFWPGAVDMMLIATLTAFLVASVGRAAWFSGVLVLAVYLVFAITLYLLPPTAPVVWRFPRVPPRALATPDDPPPARSARGSTFEIGFASGLRANTRGASQRKGCSSAPASRFERASRPRGRRLASVSHPSEGRGRALPR